MTNKLAKFIKSLRTKHRFSQAFMAEKLDIARSSYIAIENSTRDLSLDEAEILVKLFGITLADLSGGNAPKYEKYKEMILEYLRIFKNVSADGKIPKTKLAKLLYLADFAWYYEHCESMSDTQYVRRAYGPVPDVYFRALAELEETGQVDIQPKDDAILVSIGEGARKSANGELSIKERELIRAISKKWKDKKTREIVEFTHSQLPYAICRPDEVIPYALITQEDPDHVF